MIRVRICFAAAAAIVLLCASARADDDNFAIDRAPGTLSLGIGVICNTTEEAEHYVSLRRDGKHVQPAVHEVNAKARDPVACGLAAIAFKRDKTMDTQAVRGQLVSIVRVNVVGGFDGQSWKRVPQTTQYAVMQEKGEAI